MVKINNDRDSIATSEQPTPTKEHGAHALDMSEAQCRTVMRLAKIGYWEWDLIENKYHISKEAYELWGLDPQKFDLTTNLLSMLHPEDRNEAIQASQAAVRDKRPYSQDIRVVLPSGEIRYHQLNAEVICNQEGKPVRVCASVMDVTDEQTTKDELKNAQLELQKHRDHLQELVTDRTRELESTQKELVKQERLVTLGQLTATVSHELRNPLGAIIPALYTLKAKIDLDDERIADAIARIERNINRCDNIIDELLDFTRMSQMEVQPLAMDHWLAAVLNEQTVPDGISVEQRLGLGEACVVRFDPDRLRRAIINVYDNACQAMMEEEALDKPYGQARLSISSRRTAGRLELVFTDSGRGIPEDVLPNIFEPLYSTKNFGVGLGLPIVKQIMEQHGGGIDIDTEAGKGTSMILWLPLPKD